MSFFLTAGKDSVFFRYGSEPILIRCRSKGEKWERQTGVAEEKKVEWGRNLGKMKKAFIGFVETVAVIGFCLFLMSAESIIDIICKTLW